MRLSLRPRSVRGLSILIAAVSGSVMLLIGAATVYVSHEEIEAQIDHRIDLEMEALLDYRSTHSAGDLLQLVIARDGVAPGQTGYLANVDRKRRVMIYAITDRFGRRIAGSLVAGMAFDGWTEFLPIHRADGSRGFAQALSRPLPEGGQLIVAADRLTLDQTDDRIITLILIGLGAILLTGLIGTMAFGRLVQARLGAIGNTARGIMAGDFSRRVRLDGSGSEFDRLSHLLNEMLARIEALMQNLQQVSNDLAHDMRTPLSRIRRDMEELARRGKEPSTVDALQRMIADTDDLLEMFTSLLGVAEVEGFAARKRFRDIRLDGLVTEMVEAYRPTFEGQDRYLECSVSPATVQGDEQLLKRAVANLLENVLAHTRPGTGALVDLTIGDRHALLRVADEGEGIPADMREKIFERLTRLDHARGQPGHGLGLAMVRAVAHVHRGTAKVDPVGRGLAIAIRLPLGPETISPDAPSA